MYIKSNNAEVIARRIIEHKTGNFALIFIAEGCEVDMDLLIETLKYENIAFAGGVFPALIHESSTYYDGVVVSYLESVLSYELVRDMSNYKGAEENVPQGVQSIITYVDGLSPHVSRYLKSICAKYGNKCSYFGGGAGSISLKPQPCIFDASGFYKNAAIVIALSSPISMGVKHGWQKLFGPVIATKTEKNRIVQLNWESAFDVYSSTLSEQRNLKINSENFFGVAKAFPFGIYRNEAEVLVRDPIAVSESGDLICVGDVPENSVMHILEGHPEKLIEAAGDASAIAVHGTMSGQNILVVDCISRILFLEQDFNKEVEKICHSIRAKSEGASINGALTLGEISSFGEGFPEFLNKTTVVGAA
jgi:hypothetical protein